MLLADKAGSYASAKMLVQKSSDLGRRYVAATFEEALCEDGNSVGMCSDELGENICELDLVVECGDSAAFSSSVPIGQQNR